MKKIAKILLPIASTVAVAAPMTCLASCASAHFLNVKYEDVASFTYLIGDTFEPKQSLDSSITDIEPYVLGFSLPECLIAYDGCAFALSASPTKGITITITGLKLAEGFKEITEGAKISIHLKIIARDEGKEIVWTENNSTFNFVFTKKV